MTYRGENCLKREATHQKAESLRVLSFSKSNSTVLNKLIFHTKYAELSTKWKCFFTTLLATATTPTIPTKNPLLYFSEFSSPFNFHHLHLPSYFFTKPSLKSPPSLLSSIPQPFLSHYVYPAASTKNLFHYLDHSANLSCVKGSVSKYVLF